MPIPASAQIYIDVAPPAPRHEVMPPHRAGYVWQPGYHDWTSTVTASRMPWIATGTATAFATIATRGVRPVFSVIRPRTPRVG